MKSPVSAKFDVKLGEESTDKLTDAVSDAFSPATEFLGLLGDAVRLARVSVAAKITRRAKEIADQNDLKLSAPPLKFLVPFFEKASTETIDDYSLVEMWANLLASAGSSFDGRYQSYVSLLERMTSQQANILDSVASNNEGTIGQDNDAYALIYATVEARLVTEIKKSKAKTANDLMKQILERLSEPGIAIVHVAVEDKKTEKYLDWSPQHPDEAYDDELSIDFDILRSVGLLSYVTTDFIKHGRFHFTFTLYCITELGIDFWQACSGTKLTKS